MLIYSSHNHNKTHNPWFLYYNYNNFIELIMGVKILNNVLAENPNEEVYIY